MHALVQVGLLRVNVTVEVDDAELAIQLFSHAAHRRIADGVVATQDDPEIRNLRIDLTDYPEIQKAFRERRVVVVDDTDSDPLTADVRDKIPDPKSVLIVPLEIQRADLGDYVLLSSRELRPYTEPEIKFAQVVASAAVNGLSNAALYEQAAIDNQRLATLFRLAVRVFRLKVEIEEPPLTPEEMAARLTRPVVVLSRHAGPGDSFLLVHHLLALYRRRPRIVMKAALQFDPSLDVVINLLPHAFVHPRKRVVAAAPPSAQGGPGSGRCHTSRPLARPRGADDRRLAAERGQLGGEHQHVESLGVLGLGGVAHPAAQRPCGRGRDPDPHGLGGLSARLRLSRGRGGQC